MANAIGAAIASASGEVDRIFNLGTAGREAAIAKLEGGAGPGRGGQGIADQVEIVELEEIPMACDEPRGQDPREGRGPLDVQG